MRTPLWLHPKPGNQFCFRFVFVSRVRASGRGEAAWAREGCASRGVGFGAAERPGGACTLFEFFLLVYMWVLSLFGCFFVPWEQDVCVFYVGFMVYC